MPQYIHAFSVFAVYKDHVRKHEGKISIDENHVEKHKCKIALLNVVFYRTLLTRIRELSSCI